MENNKRKGKDDIGDGDDDDDELEEEKKMDEFYSLLRSFREAIDRRRRELEELEKNESKKRKTKASTWVPSFESGDFTTEVEFRGPPLIFPAPSPSASASASQSPTPCDKGKDNDQHQDDGLDLKLAL